MQDRNKLIVYLDIDGTILYAPDNGVFPETLDGQYVCNNLAPFLEFVVEQCQPYWLSYRARLGKREALERDVLPHLPAVAREIEVAYWNRNKFEGLTTEKPFLWFDDYPEEEDKLWLQQQGLMESLVELEPDQPDSPAFMHRCLQWHPMLRD